MVSLTVDGVRIEVLEGTSLLEAARKASVKLPTLCAWEGRARVGSCRVCVVEVKGAERLVAACNAKVEEGMEVYTHTPRVMAARKTNVALIMSEHDAKCLSCAKNRKCELQTLAETLGILEQPYTDELPIKFEHGGKRVIIRNDQKCVKCLRCVKVCAEEKKLNVWQFVGSGKNARVTVVGGKRLEESACDFCGECVKVCPTAALIFGEEAK